MLLTWVSKRGLEFVEVFKISFPIPMFCEDCQYGLISVSSRLIAFFTAGYKPRIQADTTAIVNMRLTHSFPMHPLAPENIRKPYGFLFSGGRERVNWKQMGS